MTPAPGTKVSIYIGTILHTGVLVVAHKEIWTARVDACPINYISAPPEFWQVVEGGVSKDKACRAMCRS